MEVLVGGLGLGHRGGAAQTEHGGVAPVTPRQGLQAPVDLGVDPADEEGGHTGHMGQIGGAARRHERLEPAQVGLHDLVVAVEPEDQRHVDAPALADEGLDRRDALAGGRHLHEQVRQRDGLVEPARVAHGPARVVGQSGRHLEGDEAVLTVALVVDGTQQTERARDVGRGHLPVGGLHAVVLHEGAELLVVGRLLAHGLGEDGRVRRDAADTEREQLGQLPVLDPVPAQVVQPRALARDVVEVLQSGHRESPFLRRSGRPVAHVSSRRGRAVPGPAPPRAPP